MYTKESCPRIVRNGLNVGKYGIWPVSTIAVLVLARSRGMLLNGLDEHFESGRISRVAQVPHTSLAPGNRSNRLSKSPFRRALSDSGNRSHGKDANRGDKLSWKRSFILWRLCVRMPILRCTRTRQQNPPARVGDSRRTAPVNSPQPLPPESLRPTS